MSLFKISLLLEIKKVKLYLPNNLNKCIIQIIMTKSNKEKEDKLFEEYKELFGDNRCEACGGLLTRETMNLEEFEDGKLYIIEKVPAFACEDCGEVWIPEPILQEFEKMIEAAKKRKKKKRKP